MPLAADDFADLYDRHARTLVLFFQRRPYDAEAAIDLMAETFAAAFRDRRSFRGTGSEEAVAWLFGIARHQLSAYYRRGAVERRALARLGVDRRPLTDAPWGILVADRRGGGTCVISGAVQTVGDQAGGIDADLGLFSAAVSQPVACRRRGGPTRGRPL